VPSTSVSIENVSKFFRLYKERSHSLKERAIRLGRNPYETFWALRDVTLDVHEGETVGLLGHNGSGKSTLLKCVAGTLHPTMGEIKTKGRVAALLELGAGFHGDLTGRENVYLNGSILGFSRAEVSRIFDDIVNFAELHDFIDLPVKHYSSGMAARLGFAVAVHVEPDVLLLDEILAVGDEAFQRKCLQRIKGFQKEGRTIFLVTHAADLVRQLCDRAAVLDRGQLVTLGAPDDAVRVFRETLLHRGIDLPPEARESRAERSARLSQEVRFLATSIEFPAGGQWVTPGGPLRIRIRYEAPEPVHDCIFAIEIHDQEGNIMIGTNTQLLDASPGTVHGIGEVVFNLPSVNLLDGVYPVSLGIHDSFGKEFDHRDQLDRFEVTGGGKMIGRVHLPLRVAYDTTMSQAPERASSR
jgi:ABC-2 type transport system ATP-binding protein